MRKDELQAFKEYQFVWNTKEKMINWYTKMLEVTTVGHIEVLQLVKITPFYYDVYDKNKNKRFRIKIQNVLDISIPEKL